MGRLEQMGAPRPPIATILTQWRRNRLREGKTLAQDHTGISEIQTHTQDSFLVQGLAVSISSGSQLLKNIKSHLWHSFPPHFISSPPEEGRISSYLPSYLSSLILPLGPAQLGETSTGQSTQISQNPVLIIP